MMFGITMGDSSGVGPEILLKAFRHGELRHKVLVYGDLAVLDHANRQLGFSVAMRESSGVGDWQTGLLNVRDLGRLKVEDISIGRISAASGAAAREYVVGATRAALSGEIAAMVTLPMNKEATQLSDPSFVGHTEWLEARCGVSRSVMMLAGERLKIALVTNHVAFRELRRAITPARIVETLRITHRALREDLGLARPRLALAALNPHAGDQGTFGDEEARLLRPALAAARAAGAPASGPYPADSVFFRAALGEFDAVVALYHDQGLIPVKLLDAVGGDPAVNVTLGLPIVRTSPDHGVAYDIAGTGKASAASMIAALRLAARVAAVRQARR